jgi:general stress protein 26
MGIATTTIEMRAPEEIRELLHEIVKDAATVLVVCRVDGGSGGPSGPSGPGERAGCAGRGGFDGRPMTLVRTGDDTTMYVVTSLDAGQVRELERDPQVAVVVPGAQLALFTAEAQISRDRRLLDDVWSDAWNQWCRGRSDPSLAILVLSPLEGSYWEANDRHSYVYRLPPPHDSPRRRGSDGIASELGVVDASR